MLASVGRAQDTFLPACCGQGCPVTMTKLLALWASASLSAGPQAGGPSSCDPGTLREGDCWPGEATLGGLWEQTGRGTFR